jgi:hypothetical protein
MPVYQVQLNAYAAIGEQNGLHPVSGLALIYMEPVTDGDAALYLGKHQEYGFDMGFSAMVHPVALKPGAIPLLLARARQLYDLPVAPAGRHNCRDCANLSSLFHLLE